MNTATPRWTVRPEGSTWGDFGPDDQLGRLNLVTREKVLQGIAEVKEGISFCLSLPLTLPGGTALNPRRQPPKLRPIGRDGYPAMNFPTSLENPKYTDLICDAVGQPRSRRAILRRRRRRQAGARLLQRLPGRCGRRRPI